MAKRLLGLLAMCMIGDGVIALMHPRGYLRLWELGPRELKEMVRELEARPQLTRVIAAMEVACGVWLALRETRE